MACLVIRPVLGSQFSSIIQFSYYHSIHSHCQLIYLMRPSPILSHWVLKPGILSAVSYGLSYAIPIIYLVAILWRMLMSHHPAAAPSFHQSTAFFSCIVLVGVSPMIIFPSLLLPLPVFA
jgi:pheromone shutdown protein TraB